MRKTLLIAALTPLAACAEGYQHNDRAFQYEIYRRQCAGGYEPGCHAAALMLQEEQLRQQRSMFLMQQGSQTLNQSLSPPAAATPQAPVNCRSVKQGYVYTTQCF